MRKGLVKKIVSVRRGGKTFQQTRWVKPKEHKSAMRRKKVMAHKRSNLPIMQRGAKPPAPPTKEEAEGAERIAKRKKVMTKWRRNAPGKGVEAKPTRQEALDILEVGRFALISAGPSPHDAEGVNTEERHAQLRDRLVEEGFKFTQVQGKYGGEEDSFLVWVHDADRETANNLGAEFNQDSIIYGENGSYEMHYTTGDRKGTVEEVNQVKDMEGENDNYTEIPLAGGGSYRFNLPFESWDPEKAYKAKPFQKGSRKEFLYGVDDDRGKQDEVLSKLQQARARKKK